MTARPSIVCILIFSSIALAGIEGFGIRNEYFGSDEVMVSTDPHNAYDGVGQTAESLPSIWLAEMFYLALSDFTVRKDVGTESCQKQTEMYIRHLKNNTYWAVQSEYLLII